MAGWTESFKSLNALPADELLYLNLVKEEFGDRSSVCAIFESAMARVRAHKMGTSGIIKVVCDLFYGRPHLIEKFRQFLPQGYQIELHGDRTRVFTIFVQSEAKGPTCKLSADERRAFVIPLVCEGWVVTKDSDIIIKEIVFDDYKQVAGFINAVNGEAIKMRHFPEIHSLDNTVKVKLTSCDVGGVSLRDITLACNINEVAKARRTADQENDE
ncbi:hypothetical protein ACOMHN_032711 [Nucella lapillus]